MTKKTKEKDIPKTTIIVLLVLTILVSVIGTWTVMESINIKEASPVQKTIGSADATIGLNIENKLEPSKTSANIQFETK